MMNWIKQHFALVCLLSVLVVTVGLRLPFISTVPSGFHADEVSFLLNARALWETGRDEDNRLFPLTLNSYIDPKPALFSYFQIPFVAVLGPTVLAARLPSVIAGVLSILVVFWIFKRLKYERLGMIVAGVLAFSPWHIVVTRATQEVIFAALFCVVAIAFLVEYLRKPQKVFLVLFGLNAFLSLYFYHSMKIFLPLMIFTWIVFLWRAKKIKLRQAAVIFAAVVIAFVLSLAVQESNSRFAAVGFLNNDQPKIQITESISAATPFANRFVLRFFYNKPVMYAQSVLSEYLAYFSPDFLFFSGGEPKRYQVPKHGLLYLIEVPLLLIGLFVSIRKKHPLLPFVLTTLFIAPIPAALTFLETPSTIRSFPLVVAMAFFVAVGVESLVTNKAKWRYLALAVLLPVFAWQLGYFWMQFSVQQAVYQPWSRNSPYTVIAQLVKTHESKYQKIRVANDLRPLYAYFALEDLIPISTIQQNPLIRNQEVSQLGKFEFTRNHCSFGEMNAQTLYIAESGCRPKFNDSAAENKSGHLEVVESVTYDDGTLVYELLEFKQ